MISLMSVVTPGIYAIVGQSGCRPRDFDRCADWEVIEDMIEMEDYQGIAIYTRDVCRDMNNIRERCNESK